MQEAVKAVRQEGPAADAGTDASPPEEWWVARRPLVQKYKY